MYTEAFSSVFGCQTNTAVMKLRQEILLDSAKLRVALMAHVDNTKFRNYDVFCFLCITLESENGNNNNNDSCQLRHDFVKDVVKY